MARKAIQNTLQSEQLLLEQIAAGSRVAYSILYSFYYPKLYKYIYPFVQFSREDTEEMLQDIFLKIWERKSELCKIKSFNSYLYSIAKNRLINFYEHNKVKQKAIHYIARHTDIIGNNADENYIYAQYQKIIQNAINAMPPKRRRVFEMSVYEELSQDKIAAELNISKSMVKKQLYAAMRYVKEYLHQYADLIAILVLYFMLRF